MSDNTEEKIDREIESDECSPEQSGSSIPSEISQIQNQFCSNAPSTLKTDETCDRGNLLKSIVEFPENKEGIKIEEDTANTSSNEKDQIQEERVCIKAEPELGSRISSIAVQEFRENATNIIRETSEINKPTTEFEEINATFSTSQNYEKQEENSGSTDAILTSGQNPATKESSIVGLQEGKENKNSNSTKNTEYITDVKDSPNIALDECKVKEILNGILDCKVLRTSSTQDMPLADGSQENSTEILLENRPGTSSQYHGCLSSKMVSVKEILGEILDYTVYKKSPPVQSDLSTPAESSMPTNSRMVTNYNMCEPEVGFKTRSYHIIRATAAVGLINSSTALHSESFISRQLSRKSLSRILPSYSTVLRLGPKRSVRSVESFIPRQPPPSYAEVEGLWDDSPTLISSDSVVFGPDPIYMVCPACRTVVVTDVERERSNVTHLVALVLCIFMCWPCCLLPYCLKSCNYSYHSCPNCRHYFGVYNPF